MLNDKETLERQLTQLKAELMIKNELIEYQDRRMHEMMDKLLALNMPSLEEAETLLQKLARRQEGKL